MRFSLLQWFTLGVTLGLPLAGCGPERVSCETPCGLQLLGESDCSGPAEYEALAIRELQPLLKYNLCRQISNFAIIHRGENEVDTHGAWYDRHGRYVGGLTYCFNWAIEIGHWNYLPHEIMHAYECWLPRPPEPLLDPEDPHKGWGYDELPTGCNFRSETSICAAIERAKP